MTFDFETDEKAEGPRNLREFTMLVVASCSFRSR